MIIRQTTEADWQKLRQIRLESLLESPKAFSWTHSLASQLTESDWRKRAAAADYPIFFFALENEHPVGLIGGVIENSEFNLISMWVAPTSRGRGVGELLVATLKIHARKTGFDKMGLLVSPENKPASHFYLKQGFVFLDPAEALPKDDKMSQKMAMKIST